jgi:hypothetical protein
LFLEERPPVEIARRLVALALAGSWNLSPTVELEQGYLALVSQELDSQLRIAECDEAGLIVRDCFPPLAQDFCRLVEQVVRVPLPI